VNNDILIISAYHQQGHLTSLAWWQKDRKCIGIKEMFSSTRKMTSINKLKNVQWLLKTIYTNYWKLLYQTEGCTVLHHYKQITNFSVTNLLSNTFTIKHSLLKYLETCTCSISSFLTRLKLWTTLYLKGPLFNLQSQSNLKSKNYWICRAFGTHSFVKANIVEAGR
jgi:hypothetical protein